MNKRTKNYNLGIFLFFGIILLYPSFSAGQQISLKEFIKKIEYTYDLTFFYKEVWIDTIQVVDNGVDQIDLVSRAIARSGLEMYRYQDAYIFIYPNRLEYQKIRNLEENLLSTEEFSTYQRIGNPSNSISEKEYTLSGYILDAEENPILGATISVNNGKNGGQTDINGKYEFNLIPGNYTLGIRYVGYSEEIRRITLYESGELNINLFTDANYLNEVVVEARNLEGDLKHSIVGQQNLEVATMESLPAFLGESDVLKSATILPGVNTAGESSSYLNVRGGGNDQTLILMNNAPVYNPGHLFGFFSIFNSDFISNVSFFKGNIPARYGIRSSSVLDVKMNNWADKKVEVYGGIGLAKSNLGVRTKLLDNKLNIHFGGRLAYPEWLFKRVPSQNIFQSSAKFSDFNLASRYTINDKNTVRTSSFFGTDYFKYADLVIYEWKMYNSSFEWNRAIKDNLIYTSNFVLSGLENNIEGLEPTEEYILKNGIENYAWTNSLTVDFTKNKLEFGAEVSYNLINAGEIIPNSSSSNVEPKTIQDEDTRNLGLFADYELSLDNGFTLNAGLRHTTFSKIGPNVSNVYEDSSPLEPENVRGQEETFGRDLIARHNAFEPRAGLNYEWGSNSIKLGYARTNQFLHLLSNTALVNPVSMWKASDQFINPTVIDQYSVGYVKELRDNSITISVEGFYKDLTDLIEYKNGSEIILNENIEQELTRGEGRAYGLEFYATQKTDRLDYWLSYTYSRAFITTDSDFEQEKVNDGKEYPYYTDRPHSVLLSTDYSISKKWSLSSTFTFSSGAPTTAPATIYQIDGIDIPYFPSRNRQRIPNYHRLDIAITYKSRIRKDKKNKDKWVFSVYNVYARQNASSVFFARDEDRPSRPFQFISIGSAIPTITYKFEF